jgi:hypothetical protein
MDGDEVPVANVVTEANNVNVAVEEMDLFVDEEADENYNSLNSDDEEKERRVKVYPNEYVAPFVVYLRATDTPMKTVSISLSLQKKYKSISSITKVSRNKLKIVFGNRNESNLFCRDKEFSEYRVYIPAADVECYGVVFCDPKDEIPDIVGEHAMGKFRNSCISPVGILDSFRFTRLVRKSDGKDSRVPTSFVRITFAGTVLPDYLAIGNLLLPVELYKPKPMFCNKCQSFGHTDSFCSKAIKCAKCRGAHSRDECQNIAKCQHCVSLIPHDLKDCEGYKKRKAYLSRRAKVKANISYAEVAKSGYYDILSDFSEEEEESDGPMTSAQADEKRKREIKKPKPRAVKRRRTEDGSWDFPEEEIYLFSAKSKDLKNPSKKPERRTPKKGRREKEIPEPDKESDKERAPEMGGLFSGKKIMQFLEKIIVKSIKGLGLSEEWQAMIIKFILPFVNSIVVKLTENITSLFSFGNNV